MIMAALMVLIVMPSCTKTPEKQIVGKWKIEVAKEDGINDVDAVGEIWNFKENGKFEGYLSMLDEEIVCKWVVDGNELTLRGGDLDVDNDELVYVFDIDEINSRNLVVSGKAKEYYYDNLVDKWSVYYELEAK